MNPRAAGGRTVRVWAALRAEAEAALGPLQEYETRAPGHAIELARAALRQGCRTVIAVGGDGTAGEAANGFFEAGAPVAPGAALGLIPQGSGSDLRRTLGIPLDAGAALEIIRRDAVRKIDVARVSFQTPEGKPGTRYALNMIGFGMGGAVAARANRSSRFLGGRLAFQLATLLTGLGFGGRTVRLSLDAGPARRLRISNIAAGNGQFEGGGMWMCPRAAPDDGWLDVSIVHYLPPLELLRALAFLYNGKIYEHPKAEFHRAARLEATADEETLIEVDGEPVGRLPVEISVLPRALTVYVPGG